MKMNWLTPAQENRLPYYRERWMGIGLGTGGTTDRQTAEKWIRMAYTVARLEAPRRVVWVDSPMACLVACSLLGRSDDGAGVEIGGGIWSLVGDRILVQAWDLIGGQVKELVRAEVGDHVEPQVWDQVWALVRDQAGTQGWNQVWDQIWGLVGDRGRARILAQVWDLVGGHVSDLIRAQVGVQIRPRVEAQIREQIGTRVRNWTGAPVSGQVAGNIMNWVENLVRDQVGRKVWNQVGPLLTDQVRSQVGDQVRNQVGAQVWDQVLGQAKTHVGSRIRNQVCARVGTRIWDQVGNRILNPVADQVLDRVRSQISDFCFGQHEADPLGVYEFFLQECGFTVCEKLLPLIHIAKHCGWWLPYREAVIVSERPVELHRNADGDLHRDGGPAVLYGDGWGVWALNGVRVPQQLVETPGDRLNPKLVLTEGNVEIRREIVRKVGVERLCEGLNARVVDARGDYELLDLDLRDGRRRPYLKMKNPSIGEYHIEGVPPDCRSVPEALAWRNRTNERPVVLT